MIDGKEYDAKFIEVLYECRCGHTQMVRYWRDETSETIRYCAETSQFESQIPMQHNAGTIRF